MERSPEMVDSPSGVRAESEQARYWNEVAGPRWVEFQERLDRQIRPLGLRALERSGVAVGERVLDVGCGCGDTVLELARRVGPSGFVTGVDVSRPMLARAQERVAAAGLAERVALRVDDAETADLDRASTDLVFSRFGVMFFARPEEGFSNLAGALRPGGRVAFVCWQRLADNPWMSVSLAAAARHVALPGPPSPEAPGPFALGDRDRLARVLARAGLRDVEIEPLHDPVAVGGGVMAEAIELILEVSPVATALREANAGPELRNRVADAVREALDPYETPEGLRMPAAAWIVTARRPSVGS